MIALTIPKARADQSMLPSLQRLLDSATRASALVSSMPAFVDSVRRILA